MNGRCDYLTLSHANSEKIQIFQQDCVIFRILYRLSYRRLLGTEAIKGSGSQGRLLLGTLEISHVESEEPKQSQHSLLRPFEHWASPFASSPQLSFVFNAKLILHFDRSRLRLIYKEQHPSSQQISCTRCFVSSREWSTRILSSPIFIFKPSKGLVDEVIALKGVFLWDHAECKSFP